MSLHSDIKNQIKDAMRAKDSLRLETLRGLVAAFMKELIDRKSNDPELADADALAVIKRAVKQRKDSIEQFEKGGRADLADKEKAELAMLMDFLPEMMPKEEIFTRAVAKKESMGITDRSKMGMLMGALMKDLKDVADGQDVKEVVEGLFKA